MVKFKYYTNSQKIAFAVSKIFIDQVKAKPNTVFILATGSSPLLTYQELVKDYQSNHTD
jgi:6-phosphogluconolactonase/glucosamine-6-phosphate isomerase/deaminase